MVFVAAVAGGKTTVRPVPVTLGPAQGAWIAVIGPIQDGDQVIVEGNDTRPPRTGNTPRTKEVAYP